MHRSLLPVGLAVAWMFSCGGRTDLEDGTLGSDGAVASDVGNGSDGTSGGPDGSTPPSDAAMLPDSPLPPPPTDSGSPGTPIECGMTTCNSATDVCCITFAGMMVSETCTSATSCMGVALTCSSALNCMGGEVCCGNIGGGMAGSECEPACKGGFTNPQLCASSAECPKGQMCTNTPFGYKICR